MSSLGQRGLVGQKVSIAGFLDRVGHLGGVDQDQDTSSTNVKDTVERGGCRCTKATVSETVTIETVTITLPPQ